MKKNFRLLLVFFTLAVAVTSCNTTYKSQQLAYHSYTINDSLKKDTALISFLAPYKANVNMLMSEVVGHVEIDMEKKIPESELGNFLTDAYLHMAKEKYKTHVDAAIMNYGGIRLHQLLAGYITRGSVFEIMPFDNLLILQKIKGTVLQQFLDHTASLGGWPVAGISMQIKNKKAVHVLIGGNPLDPEKIYTIANSDYVANGGDNSFMLKDIPQLSNGYLMRDAIFDYIKYLKGIGKNIDTKIENRVTNVE
ncbi:MAG: 5'-nucleotidase C-terminal domain-containing protein [Chitinophagaceae bacterium]|nr:5'-nucleotidase C-terminal domain-containing protein [Chitinophagaceae bacterium]